MTHVPVPLQRAALPPAPITTYYLSSPDSSARSTVPKSSPQPVPPTSLVLSLTHPHPSSSPATAFFLSCLPDPVLFIHHAAPFILEQLSLDPGAAWRHQSIQLELEEKGGLAATSGGKIGVSLRWVENIMKDVQSGHRTVEAAVKEFKGVLLHELVHTIQHDGGGSTPGWLIESIADLVRLEASLDPPHWRKPGQGSKNKGWEQGYDAGARFLSWLIGGDKSTAARGGGVSTQPKHAIGASTQTVSDADWPHSTQYPLPPSSPDPSTNSETVRPVPGPRPGPFPDLIRLIDSRLRYERWDEIWWEEMTGKRLDQLWEDYLGYYA